MTENEWTQRDGPAIRFNDRHALVGINWVEMEWPISIVFTLVANETDALPSVTVSWSSAIPPILRREKKHKFLLRIVNGAHDVYRNPVNFDESHHIYY